jgi:hypothetical protein
MKKLIGIAIVAASLGSLEAQMVQERRATMRGSRGGGSGKCTIEVRVDGVAEVEITGDRGRLRTVSGMPASWVRMECSDPLPANMADFRFKGIDGRGRQDLIRDPRNSRGVAVIRIEDPKGGSEGYTFDIEWGGPAGGGGGPAGGRGGSRMGTEAAIDLCRSEVRARAQRDYGLRDIDITSAAMEDNPGRRDWISGTFAERGLRRGAPFRFACSVDFSSGVVRNVEISRPVGPGGGSDRGAGIRNCQDAVVARINRDGYQNIRFGSTDWDNRRGDMLIGTATAERGRNRDSFEFSCAMDNAGRVRSADVRRR